MPSPGQDQLQHLVVLMLETRSFDTDHHSSAVLTKLAREFAMFSRWFAAVPSPTRCHRTFAHYGTSCGHMGMPPFDAGRQCTSIYERIIDADLTAKLYCVDETRSTRGIVSLPEDQPQLVGAYDRFLADCEAGTLPAYAFVEPNTFDHDGNDETIVSIYNAIRHNAALWRTTALLVTYEHTEPPPEADRLGVRVPAVLISPWIPKGTIVDDRVFEHASIPATATEWLLPSFNDAGRSPREAAAETFLDLLSLEEMRTDTAHAVTPRRRRTLRSCP